LEALPLLPMSDFSNVVGNGSWGLGAVFYGTGWPHADELPLHRPGSTGRVGVAVFDCSFRCNARVANRCLRALCLRRGDALNGKSRLAASARKQSSSTYWSSKSITFLWSDSISRVRSDTLNPCEHKTCELNAVQQTYIRRQIAQITTNFSNLVFVFSWDGLTL